MLLVCTPMGTPMALAEELRVTENGREFILEGYYDKDGDFIIEQVRPASPEPAEVNAAPTIYDDLMVNEITEGPRPDAEQIRNVDERGEEIRTFSLEDNLNSLTIDDLDNTLISSGPSEVVITEARPEITPEYQIPTTLSNEELASMTPKKALKELDREMQILTSRVLTINRDLVLMTDNRYFPTPKHHEFLDAGRLLADIKLGKTIDYQTEANARLAELYLAYGMHSDAAVIYHNLENQDQGRLISDEAWLNLGRTQLKRGYFNMSGEVEYALSHISRRADRGVRSNRDILLAQLYLEQKRNTDAESVLDDWRGPDEMEPFVEYNQAVALMRSGDAEEAVALLDDIGTMNETSPSLLALRDRANLSLGQHFIKERQGATAIPILQRVRVNGPYSNAALLALGWASLTELGKRNVNLNRIPKDCFEKDPTNNTSSTPGGLLISNAENPACKARPSFARTAALDEASSPMLNALTPWLTLIDRDLTDPAVHEGLLAVPYAFEKMREPRYAAKYYNEAIQKFAQEKQNISFTLQGINDGTMLRALLLREPGRQNASGSINYASVQSAAFSGWRTDDLRKDDGIDVDRLHTLLSSHVFREALANYRHLQVMRRNMGDWEQLVDEFDARLTTAGIPGLNALQQRSLQLQSDVTGPDGSSGTAANPYYQEAPQLSMDTQLSLGSGNDPALRPNGDVSLDDDGLVPEQTPAVANPLSEGSLTERVRAKKLRIAAAQLQISQAIYNHEQFLRRLATVTLERRRQRIDLYLQRANYSRARMADILQMTAPDAEDLNDQQTTPERAPNGPTPNAPATDNNEQPLFN